MSDELEKLKEQYHSLQKEFTEFTYIVSHDLSGPIRHFKEFSKLLFDSIEIHMNEDTKQYQYFLNKSIKAVEGKLDVILKLSRVNTSNWHCVPLDSRELILSTINNLLELKDFEFSFSGDFPSLNVDLDSCYTVFYNIIHNGIQFVDSCTVPNIQIHSSQTEKGDFKFTISDNGIGIAENKIDSVFEIFKRLSHAFEGEGAGLTLARKIMCRYAGEISISSTVGQGSDVTIVFPKEGNQ
ncbi:MAG: HAMP domain-containing histidine kinase [Lentisphaeraceae bacterium]|nr:HAMP domain-containing histidine kinase [Lentisphaeraceae bacterium]